MENEPRKLAGGSLPKHGQPDLFSQFDKRPAAEFKNRLHHIDNQVIMEDLVIGDGRKLARHRELTVAGIP